MSSHFQAVESSTAFASSANETHARVVVMVAAATKRSRLLNMAVPFETIRVIDAI
jgi:hypothetical protein